MGLRASVTVSVTSFLLGSLFTHWIADSRTLWKSTVTDEHLWTAASYYNILTNGPSIALYVFAAAALLGGVTILWSFRDGKADNLMFDGSSFFLFGASIAMYLYSVIPILFTKFSSLPTHQLKDPFPRALRIATLDLASNNLFCSVALTGVLALQAGRFWTESSRSDDFPAAREQDSTKQSKGIS